ncbi:MAG: hypothetical protein H7Y18_03125 [Clostridiaceae bacterium]|nr:hypothetical protein [Clostridiaceae bacterium]
MKKIVIGWDLPFFICGIIFILMGLFIKTLPYRAMIGFMGCSFMGSSIGGFYKKYRLLKSKDKINKTRYEEQLKDVEINLNDERKIMLRQKSGQITDTIMSCALIILNIIFIFIGVEKWIIYTLCGVITFKYICGVVIFYYLSKKM